MAKQPHNDQATDTTGTEPLPVEKPTSRLMLAGVHWLLDTCQTQWEMGRRAAKHRERDAFCGLNDVLEKLCQWHIEGSLDVTGQRGSWSVPDESDVRIGLQVALSYMDLQNLKTKIRELKDVCSALSRWETVPDPRRPPIIAESPDERRRMQERFDEQSTIARADETECIDKVFQAYRAVRGDIRTLERSVVRNLVSPDHRTKTRRTSDDASADSFTPPELAKRWGVSPDKVRAWIDSGTLKAMNVSSSQSSGPRYRVTRDEVLRFESVRSLKPTSPPTTVRPRRKDSEQHREILLNALHYRVGE